MTTKEKIEFLVSRGVSITELAKRTECSNSTLARWLRGETNLSKRLEKDLNQTIISYLTELDTIRE